MARRTEKPRDTRAPRQSNRSFVDMMKSVPKEKFVSMVSKCGMPAEEARDLCRSFAELKK
jgi:hypothetical protein